MKPNKKKVKKITIAQKKVRAADKIINNCNLDLIIDLLGLKIVLACYQINGKRRITIQQLHTRLMGIVATRCFELGYEVVMITLITGLSSSKIYPLLKLYNKLNP